MANTFPPGFIELAKVYASKVPGDAASIILAQAALETGWFTSQVWNNGGNPFGIRDAQDARFQTEGNGAHAAYKTLSNAFKDRVRILQWYGQRATKEAPELAGDVLGQLGRWWAPVDPKYPTNTGYVQKIQRIINENDLTRYDTVRPARPAELKPTAPYKPAQDPRDNYSNNGGKTMAAKKSGGLGGLFTKIILPVALSVITGGSSTIVRTLLGTVLGGILSSERDDLGNGGEAKEDAAVDHVSPGTAGSGSLLEVLLRAVIQALVSHLNKSVGRDWGKDSDVNDGKSLLSKLLA